MAVLPSIPRGETTPDGGSRMRETLTILASADGGHRVLRVGGELDLATAPQLAAALANVNGERSVLVDLHGLSFIDSCGFSVLYAAHNRLESEGRKLIITGMSPIGLRAL